MTLPLYDVAVVRARARHAGHDRIVLQAHSDSKAVPMSTVSICLALAIRVLLVLLFLPFSALDKIFDFRSAVGQAQEAVQNKVAATALILVGLLVEVFMSAGVISGIADRACAFVLAGYCAVTALVWKQFWRPGDFWSASNGKARTLFWDFWKNLALSAGFLLIVFGTDAASIAQFLAHPTIQSHPYRLKQQYVPQEHGDLSPPIGKRARTS